MRDCVIGQPSIITFTLIGTDWEWCDDMGQPSYNHTVRTVRITAVRTNHSRNILLCYSQQIFPLKLTCGVVQIEKWGLETEIQEMILVLELVNHKTELSKLAHNIELIHHEEDGGLCEFLN